MKESLLLLILLIALFFDLSTHKIPNKLILWGGFIGSIFFFYEQGIAKIGILFMGMLLPIVILVLPYTIGALGAGDVKLFSIMSAFIGIVPTFTCIFYSFCVGAVISLFILLYKKSLLNRLKYFLTYFITVVHTGKLIPYYDVTKDGYQYTMHFSIAILLGTGFYLLEQILY
jgi:prepilin peptidase CpaA